MDLHALDACKGEGGGPPLRDPLTTRNHSRGRTKSVDSSGLAPTAVHTCSLQLCGTQRPQPCPIRACLCPIHRLAAAPLHAPPWQVPKGGGRRSQRGQVILLEVRGGQEGANHPPLHFPWGHERGE